MHELHEIVNAGLKAAEADVPPISNLAYRFLPAYIFKVWLEPGKSSHITEHEHYRLADIIWLTGDRNQNTLFLTKYHVKTLVPDASATFLIEEDLNASSQLQDWPTF